LNAVQQARKALLVGVGLKADSYIEIKDNLAELSELVLATGSEIVGSFTQMMSQYNPATLLGAGKVDEITQAVKDLGVQVVVIDHHLSGVQTRNLETALACRVLDRSQIILEIFAERARTYEGKLQVELATLSDQLPRMIGAWMNSLSRQGGGIGTRGPGETALEQDKRKIREKITLIRKKLEDVRKHRAQHRNLRKRGEIPSFALIGYTNSGKSSLLNVLTGAKVLAKNQVFATLDPTTRKIYLPDSPPAVVTDTVGFIRKLPPHLIEAFKATLEESSEADVLIHVIDASSPSMQKQIEVVQKLMTDLNWEHKKLIHVYNKMDAAPIQVKYQAQLFPRVFTSALSGEGIDQLKHLMQEMILAEQKKFALFFPKHSEYKIYDLLRESKVLLQEPASQGTFCEALLDPKILPKWEPYLVK
jgi:GTP-binding protein HflX